MIKFIDIKNDSMTGLIMVDSIQAVSYSFVEGVDNSGVLSFFLANNYNFNIPIGTKEETIKEYNKIRDVLNEN